MDKVKNEIVYIKDSLKQELHDCDVKIEAEKRTNLSKDMVTNEKLN